MAVTGASENESDFELWTSWDQLNNNSQDWNGRNVVLCSQKKDREKELKKLKEERPDKNEDPQGYYTYKAREEQIKFEITIRKAEEAFAKFNWYDAAEYYSDAQSHLTKRTEYESKAAKARNETYKKGGNPPPLNIQFINNGAQLNWRIASW